jgi:hypothetical protein
VVPREMVANWLYGVACHTARKARVAAARRAARERQVSPMPEPAGPPPGLWDELWPVLDRELGGLPDRYRAPLVLCDLEGKTRKEAARQLGWTEGTLSGRLARARALLARRLARRGLTLSAGVLAAALAENKVSAVPAALAAATARGAVMAGMKWATVSARAVALAEGVVKTMLLSKANLAVVLFLIAGVAGLATHLFLDPARAGGPPEGAAARPAPAAGKAEPVGLRQVIESVPWILMKVDPPKRTLSVRMMTHAQSLMSDDLVFHHLEGLTTWRNMPVPISPAGSRLAIDDFPVDRGAKVCIEGKEGRLADLKEGMRLTLKLAAGEPAVARIDARLIPSGGDTVLKAADAAAKTITITLGGKELTLAVAADVQVITNTTGVGQFKDLEPGMRLSLALAVEKDRIVVKRILAKKDLE